VSSATSAKIRLQHLQSRGKRRQGVAESLEEVLVGAAYVPLVFWHRWWSCAAAVPHPFLYHARLVDNVTCGLLGNEVTERKVMG
jgi:hypothetical protein